MKLSTISVFYKQRNNFFFPVTSYALPTNHNLLKNIIHKCIIFTALTYFVVGFAPDAGRCAAFPRTVPTQLMASASQCSSRRRNIAPSMPAY